MAIRFRFSLRLLLVLLVLASIPFAWCASRAHRQRRSREAIERVGGRVIYSTPADNKVHWWMTTGFIDFFLPVKYVQLPAHELSETVNHLESLPNLELDLRATVFCSDEDLSHLRAMTNLSTLYVSGSRVSDNGLHHLVGLKDLRTLLLEKTSVTDNGVAELKTALPDCTIQSTP